MLDLAGADAVGQGAEGPMGGGVAVAADDGHARLGAALFRPDHMDDAVADIAHGEEFDPGVLHIARQGLKLQPRLRVLHRVHALGLADGGDIVVGDRQRQVRAPHLAVVGAQAREGLRRRHLMDQVQVDIEDGLAIRVLCDHVGVPDLVIKASCRSWPGM